MEPENIECISSDDNGEGLPKISRRAQQTQAEQKKRKPKSCICEYFEKLHDEEGKTKANCSHCSQDVNPNNLKDQNEGGSSLPPGELDTQKIRKALAKMIIIDQLPFRFVASEGFKEFIAELCPNYTLPSPLEIARDCCEYFLKKKMKLKKLFTKSKQRICLTTNIWTSEEGVDFMCLTAQFIDDDWTLHNKTINFKPLFSGKGDEIGSTIIDCLKEWKIEHVMTITMDNTSSSDAAIKFLKSGLPNLVCDGKYLHIRCMTHIINLVVKEGFKSLNDGIERIQNAVRYISISPDRVDMFKSCVVEKKLQSKTFLCLDWPGRWNTTYDMLKRALEFEKAFELFEAKDPDFKYDLENDVPSRIDWMYARKFVSLLEFLKSKTTQISNTTYVVANQFLSEVMDIDTHLNELKNEQDLRFKLVVNKMREMFSKYWGDEKKSCMMLYFAVILDPRMKLEVIKYGFTEICNLKKEPNTEQEVVNKMVKDMVKAVVDEFGLLFNEYELTYQTTNSNDISELQKYLKDATMQYSQEVEFDILQWWKLNS